MTTTLRSVYSLSTTAPSRDMSDEPKKEAAVRSLSQLPLSVCLPVWTESYLLLAVVWTDVHTAGVRVLSGLLLDGILA